MPFAIWISGLPGSGKSVRALALKNLYEKNGIDVQILRSDEIRKVLTPHPKYTEEEREIVYRAIVYMAKLLVDNGKNVIIDATAHKKEWRNLARQLIKNFAEVYLRCPIKVCIEREGKRKDIFAPSKIYKKGLTGESKTVPGIGVVYEESESPEVIIETDKIDPKESAKIIFEKVYKLWEIS
ncbi:MAG: adenylyl-sulfate kinase [Euryarchaeota archaeon]|nr:adenylyl-sulfate kinase [Euryarchaeota archaeon]